MRHLTSEEWQDVGDFVHQQITEKPKTVIEWKCVTRRISDGDIWETWDGEIGDLRIIIMNNHIAYRGQWVMCCYRIGMDTVLLKSGTVDEAKRDAIEMVKERVGKWYEALEGAES